MGRFDPKYSAEQKEAVIAAQVEAGMSSTEAVAYARDGKYEGLGPFEMPQSTASFLATEERKRRRGDDLKKKSKGTPTERLEVATSRLLGVFDTHVQRAEARARRSKTSTPAPVEFDRLRNLARFGREVQSLVKGVPIQKAGHIEQKMRSAAKAEREQEAASPDDDLVASMLRENGMEVEPARRGRPPQQNGDTA